MGVECLGDISPQTAFDALTLAVFRTAWAKGDFFDGSEGPGRARKVILKEVNALKRWRNRHGRWPTEHELKTQMGRPGVSDAACRNFWAALHVCREVG